MIMQSFSRHCKHICKMRHNKASAKQTKRGAKKGAKARKLDSKLDSMGRAESIGS